MRACFRFISGMALAVGFASGPAASAELRRATIDGIPVIEVSGQLQYGDEHRFAELASGMSKAAVVLDGPGGNLLAGLEIGRAIRQKGFTTIVPRSCASACATAWLGGRPRMVAPGARVGFHAASQEIGGQTRVVATGNALVGAYLNQLGLSSAAILYLTDAGPSDMKWLSQADARSVGIDVQWGDDRPAIQAAARSLMPSASYRPQAVPDTGPQAYAPTQAGEWAAYGDWIQVASRKRLDLAVPVAEAIRDRTPNTAVFLFDNGWSVVAIGPFRPGTGQLGLEALLATGEIPDDSMVVDGTRFVALQWGQRPGRLFVRPSW